MCAGRQTEGGPTEEGRRRPGARQGSETGGARFGRPTGRQQVVLVERHVHAVFLAGRQRHGFVERRGRQGRVVLDAAAQQRAAERFRVRRLVAQEPGVRVQVGERVTSATPPLALAISLLSLKRF